MRSNINLLTFLQNIVMIFGCFLLVNSCGEDKKKQSSKNKPVRTVSVPNFNADSAYFFVNEQVEFGPRVPNTGAHYEAGNKIISRLEAYGAKVDVQSFEATTYDGVTLQLRNIMGSYNNSAKKRILLAAHWDTRPWASKDPSNPKARFDGANDGASGVGVLLEIARNLQAASLPDVGVDLLFFDGEDWGEEGSGVAESWCLGSQYWANNKDGYAAYYGILLDMVGGKNARFPFEEISEQMAKKVLTNVWRTASEIGYGNYFIAQSAGPITDDHYYVNTIAKIPMVNILHWEPELGYFGDWHHSQRDNMDLIDRNTLKAVGQTVLHVVYYE